MSFVIEAPPGLTQPDGTYYHPDAGLDSACPELTVETVTEWPAFEALRNEWNQLLQASDADCLFLTWEWAATWWKHLGEPSRLIVFAVRRRQQLVAIAPFRIRPSHLFQQQPFRVLELLGTGFVGSDYLDIIARRGHEADVLDALARNWSSCKGVRHTSIKWNNLRRGDCLIAQFAARLNAQGWILDEMQTNVCPFIPLQGHSWEGYLSSLGAEHRSDFKRKWNRLNRDFDVQFERPTTPEDCADAIDLLIEQHNLRWRHRGGSDAFHTPELVTFHREVSQVANQKGWLRLYILRLDDKPAASLYGFLYGGRFYFYQSGFDIAYEKYSVGMITMGLAIQKAIEEGATEYDLLHGNETYKSHWSRDRRALGRVEMYPPGLRGLLYRSSMNLARASRDAAQGLMARAS